ncbi:MAG TPA: carbohydrate porin [Xanthomonadaceae bacterium]|jgi:hypothetical protein
MRASLIATAIVVALGAGSLNAVAATDDAAATTPAAHHHHKAAKKAAPMAAPAGPNMQAELAMRDQEIADLKNALANVEAKVGELEQRTDAQSDVNVQTAQSVSSLQDTAKKTDKLEKIVNDTTVGGRVFVDISDLDKKTTNLKTGAVTKGSTNGDGLDVKRGYLTVNHSFNDIWSASLTTDFNYVSADSETQLFIKNLYVQGKFDDAFIFRAGAIPMAWIPFAENWYGYRYVENTLIDRLKFGNSADWGLSASGKLGGGMFDYAAAAVNGGGYKNPTRSDSMDFEGRVAFSPIDNTVIAVGGYSGDLGKETATTKTPNTATRGDAMIAYAKGNTRLGAEYFEASNWTPGSAVPLSKDKAEGYSIWASYGFTDVLSLFGRYDNVKPNKDTDPSLKDKYYNFGLQWDVRKGFKLAAVYKNEDLRDSLNPVNPTDAKTEEFGIFGDVSF